MSAKYIEGIGFIDTRKIQINRRVIEEFTLLDGEVIVKIDGKSLRDGFTYEQAIAACIAESQLTMENRNVMRRRAR